MQIAAGFFQRGHRSLGHGFDTRCGEQGRQICGLFGNGWPGVRLCKGLTGAHQPGHRLSGHCRIVKYRDTRAHQGLAILGKEIGGQRNQLVRVRLAKGQ